MSGHVPRNPDGSLIVGRVGDDMSVDEAYEIAKNIGYPVLVRPSYVLGGRGMQIVYDNESLQIGLINHRLVIKLMFTREQQLQL